MVAVALAFLLALVLLHWVATLSLAIATILALLCAVVAYALFASPRRL